MTKIDPEPLVALPTETVVTGRPPARRQPNPFRKPLTSIIRHALLIALAALMLYPVIWMVVSSLRPNDEIFREPGIVFDSFEISNYTDGWTALQYPFNVYLWNSAVIVAGCIAGNLISCSMAAYAFARLEFTAKRLWFGIMLLSIMLPIHVIIVPQYILFSQLGWVNTFLPLIVPKLLAVDAFFVFLMVQFIRGIPKELDEAARIDGAGHPRIFLQVILPLMTPALATTAIFTFIWTWNDFFSQLVFLTKPELYTVPLALRSFEDAQSVTNYAQMFAMSVVSLVPIFLIFLFGQKFLIKGIATTGIK
ncbi:carbohydrate ABC transporter permease [Microbacterium jejuense]|uniref:Carbohydrate ABC transporter permease n=1 Tax=Microbacterium jejuense TaxID=1263637 RepID=A0ABS7HI63_9MICO|nr:carbohydrate ABC transporter permease [Microbacterium jejuense]MBW9092405.1 carbohydrate ABC transporter permease [Microbacterium jejuense]